MLMIKIINKIYNSRTLNNPYSAIWLRRRKKRRIRNPAIENQRKVKWRQQQQVVKKMVVDAGGEDGEKRDILVIYIIY